jgi:hypothetical protein
MMTATAIQLGFQTVVPKEQQELGVPLLATIDEGKWCKIYYPRQGNSPKNTIMHIKADLDWLMNTIPESTPIYNLNNVSVLVILRNKAKEFHEDGKCDLSQFIKALVSGGAVRIR